MDVLKNPMVIGLTIATITYAYLNMSINEKNKRNKLKKKDKKIEKVNLLIPLVMGLIGWFIAYAYFEYNDDSIKTDNNVLNKINPLPLPLPPSPKYNFIKDLISESSEPQAYTLINQGVNIPHNIPDVILDMY